MRNAARAVLLVFVFVIPWEYSLELGAPIGNIARTIGLMSMSVAALAVLRTGRIRSFRTFQWFTIALYLWYCCTFLWTSAPHNTAAKLRGYAQEMMLAWLIWEFVESPDDLRSLMRAWLGGSWVLAILTMAAWVRADASGSDQIRFVAAGQDPNDTARFLVLAVPIAALLVSNRGRWFDQVLGLCYFPVALGAVMLTGSRSGFLIAVVAFAGSGIMLFREHRRHILIAMAAIPLIAALVLVNVPSGTVDRIGTIAGQLQKGDLNQRVNIWLAGWRAFVDAPICGHGAGSFAMAARLSPEDTAHNTALGVLVEGGLCAFLLATAIVVVSVHTLFSSRRSLRVGLGTPMAVWLIASMVNTVGENRITWLMLGIIATAGRISDRYEESSSDDLSFHQIVAEEVG